ncbi:hypothetical protein N9U18_00960 [Candidatus Pelagibacter sp.]|nr:hypothetical protein [Candidatus Pelagibacter sp.]MDA9709214.1 hypothetical protein [Candidatus Pelagibacter sp.]
MKKVLLVILAGLFTIGSAYAQPSYTIGIGFNKGVFAAEGKEDNFSETGSLASTTTEYGAFEDSYASIYVEVGNETGSIGIAYQDDVSTPTNVNEVGGMPSSNSATSKVSADFSGVITFYGLVNLPMNTYLKAGIVQGDIAVNETQKSGNTYKDQDLEGYVLGFGYQHEADQANIRFELLGHTYDDVSADNGVATSGNHNKITISDMIGANAQISVNKSF